VRGRQKDKNLLVDPRITILAVDPDDGYRWLEIRGMVESITEAGGVTTSKNYRGNTRIRSITAASIIPNPKITCV
jgi:hypothetical protein